MELLKFAEGVMPTKADIKDAVLNLSNRYADGGLDVNPMRDYIALKVMEAFVKDALKVCEPWAVQSAATYSEAERKNIYGAKVVIKAGAVEYDYDSADVTRAQESVDVYAEELKRAKARLKETQDFAIKMQMAAVVDKKPDSLIITLQ